MSSLAFFVLIYNYLNHEINSVVLQNMVANTMQFAVSIGVVLVTLWILIQGYRIMTGQSREPMMALVTNMARIALIVTVATSMALFGTELNDFFTNQLGGEINYLINHGTTPSLCPEDDNPIVCTIDQNLAVTQAAMIAIDSVASAPPTDVHAAMRQSRALTFATLGVASPPMAAAAMLLLYQFAIALVIGLAPIFILCLIFDQTRELFRKWLLYGIGTLFSMAVLNLVVAIVMKMTLAVALAFWSSGLINAMAGNNSEGLTTQAMEQGGVGLLLTVLIVSVPPMAAMFFNGTMGQFLYFSAFGRSGLPGPHGEPPGAYARGYAAAPVGHETPQTGLKALEGYSVGNPARRVSGAMASPATDVIRSQRHDV